MAQGQGFRRRFRGFEADRTTLAIVAAGATLVGAILFPRLWGFSGPLEPSPVERRLQSRFLSSLAPLAFVVVVGLMAGDWIAAGRAATNTINGRLESSAKMAANTVPAFLEMGQNLIQILAKDPTWTKGTLSEKNVLLGDNLRTIPYFNEFYLLDINGRSVTGYPMDDFYAASPSSEEYMGITLALNGMPIQMYTLPPSLGGAAARLSFLASVYDDKGVRSGVLVGRTDLASNPFTESLIISLNSLSDTNGEGMLPRLVGSCPNPSTSHHTEYSALGFAPFKTYSSIAPLTGPLG